MAVLLHMFFEVLQWKKILVLHLNMINYVVLYVKFLCFYNTIGGLLNTHSQTPMRPSLHMVSVDNRGRKMLIH